MAHLKPMRSRAQPELSKPGALASIGKDEESE